MCNCIQTHSTLTTIRLFLDLTLALTVDLEDNMLLPNMLQHIVQVVCVTQAVQQDVSQANKIELVAKALRAALLASPGGQGRFLKPILATFAVVGDLEGALGIVKEVKERQLAADGKDNLTLVTMFASFLAGTEMLQQAGPDSCSSYLL